MTDDAHEQLQRLRVRMGFISANDAGFERIGERYQVIKELGEGGMGKVFLVRDTRFESSEAVVALKLVESDDAALQDRLWREAHALLSLRKSKHVVPVYDVGKHGTHTYFTMRHVAGGTLREWQVGKPLPDILDAYLRAGQGLCDAHDKGIVHRDFKPENVLVEGNDVLVADFGLAASFEAASPEGSEPETDGGLRKPGRTIGGTLPYMAPEQIAGEPADARTDQFSFSVALWEASAGCLPWTWKRGSDQIEALRRPPKVKSEIPGWLRQTLLRGMAVERKHRFPDLRSLCDALERGRLHEQRILRVGGSVLALGISAAIGAVFAFESPEPCDDFVAAVDAHWPNTSIELDDAIRTRLDSLVARWRSDAAQLCVGDDAPSPTLAERRCMLNWLSAFDAAIEVLSVSMDASEVIENLEPTPLGYCEMRRINLDSSVQYELDRARSHSLAGNWELADVHLSRAERRAEQLAAGPTPTAELAEVHAARVEVLARSGRIDEARRVFVTAERSTTASIEARSDLFVFWAKSLALQGKSEERQTANSYYHEGKGMAGVKPEGLRAAELAEAAGHVARAF